MLRWCWQYHAAGSIILQWVQLNQVVKIFPPKCLRDSRGIPTTDRPFDVASIPPKHFPVLSSSIDEVMMLIMKSCSYTTWCVLTRRVFEKTEGLNAWCSLVVECLSHLDAYLYESEVWNYNSISGIRALIMATSYTSITLWRVTGNTLQTFDHTKDMSRQPSKMCILSISSTRVEAAWSQLCFWWNTRIRWIWVHNRRLYSCLRFFHQKKKRMTSSAWSGQGARLIGYFETCHSRRIHEIESDSVNLPFNSSRDIVVRELFTEKQLIVEQGHKARTRNVEWR